MKVLPRAYFKFLLIHILIIPSYVHYGIMVLPDRDGFQPSNISISETVGGDPGYVHVTCSIHDTTLYMYVPKLHGFGIITGVGT